MEYQIAKYIPWYVIHKHIIPYTYELQPKQLRMDIRSFKVDYAILDNMYHTRYTSCVLYNDLYNYCNRNSYLISTKCQEMLHPHLILYNNTEPSSPELYLRHSRLIWGLLSPHHRTDFINKYILMDEIELF